MTALWRIVRWLLRHWRWVCSGIFVLVVLVLGTIGFQQIGKGFYDALYGAIQLFGLNYDIGDFGTGTPDNPDIAGNTRPADLPMTLQFARFMAPFVLIVALVKLLADGLWIRLRRVLNTNPLNKPRDVVVGFGPLGREIGRRLIERKRAVTWIDRIDGGDAALDAAREAAERIGGVLVEGDPSDLRQLRAAHVARAKKVIIALRDDLAGFDAAEAVRACVPEEVPIRLFTENPVIAGHLPAAAQTGFVTGRGVELFNIRADAVRKLVTSAQWDRQARLLGQDRVHLVIAGLGWQGEALLEETLLQCNCVGLKPPLVTVIDLEAAKAEARLRRRSPALLDPRLEIPGWLPVRFVEADLETVDFATLRLQQTGQQRVPVTAWAICTGDDDLNLRTALQLQSTIRSRRLDGAPIHIRIWAGHASDSHRIGTDGLTMSVAFGGLADGLDTTTALKDDPDKFSRALHDAYRAAKAASPGLSDPAASSKAACRAAVPQPDPAWNDLPPTMKNSNRRSHRHGPMKLAALNFDWKHWHKGWLPVLSDSEKTKLHDAQRELALADFDLPEDQGGESAAIRKRFHEVVKAEHDRWIIDRAIDGWRYGPLRDNDCLLHPSMCSWPSMDRSTRAFDAVQVRTFIDREGKRSSPTAHERKVLRITVGQSLSVRADLALYAWDQATEVQILLPARPPSSDEAVHLSEARKKLIEALKTALRILARAPKLCRVFLLFPAPPGAAVLAFANELAAEVETEGVAATPVWAWRKGAGTGPRLPVGFQDGKDEVASALLASAGRFRPDGVSLAADVWSNVFRDDESIPRVGFKHGRAGE